MSALLQGVILYASTFIVLVGVGLLWDVWRHKDSFEIAARSPVLLCLAGAAHVALVFLQMIAGVVDSFSCRLVIWASYISFGTITAAYLLRAARLVIVYDRDLRRKYQRLVKPSAQRKCMAVVLAPCCLVALLVGLLRKRSGLCLFFAESWSFFLPTTMLYLVAMGSMANRLKDTRDAFNIRNEMGYICLATAITSATRTVHITFVRRWGDLNETFPPTVHDLIACSAALYVSFYRPLKAFYGVGSRKSLHGIQSARRIYSGDDDDGYDNNRQVGGAWGDENKPETWGVLQILRNGTLRGLLINFCEQSLCGESVDFLVDVAINYESLTDPVEQFGALSEIVENYLAQGSANEVNVSNAQRNAAAAWLTKRDEFIALQAETRAHVLDRQRDEIAKMLGENLLDKFKKTPIAVTAMRAMKEVAAAECSQGEECSEIEDEGMRIMLQASAALEVARIQRITRVEPSSAAAPWNPKQYPASQRSDSFNEITYDGSDSFTMYTIDSGDA
eukprot:g8139.t1